MFSGLIRSFLQAAGTTVMVVCLVQISGAQVMSSSNFKIQSDSINTGGLFSTSTNFGLEDTIAEVATGISTSSNFNLKAGYQQMQETFISLSAISDVVMTPSLPGLTGGTSTASSSFTVKTDSVSGYSVTLVASNDPAMQSSVGSISDYVPASAVPDFLFITNPPDAHFAYSVEGVDISLRFQDAGGVCGVSGGDTVNRCFDGLSTTPVEIARRNSPNVPDGSTTTIRFVVGLGGSAGVPQGAYEATTTVTALSL